jgi:phosphoribulokinase
MLGVVGDSAAGKTTISAGIAKILGADRVTVICVDDYHRYNREQRKALDITALHPDCNYIDIMEQHVEALRRGEPILKPVYNHRTGDFDPPVYVQPARFVIVEGLLGFQTQRLRDCFNVKVYLDPPESLRREWKIKRDTAKRGYTREQVIAELEKREADSAAYIRPQQRWADLVVRFYRPEREHDDEHLNVLLTMRSTMQQPDVEAIAATSGIGADALRLSVGRDGGRLTEYLEVEGSVTPEQAAAIEEALWAQEPALARMMPSGVGRFRDFANGEQQRCSYPLALSQLIIAYHLLRGRLAKERALHALKAQVEAAVSEPLAPPAREGVAL